MKNRMAFGLIEAAEKSGALGPGMRVVEVTGGSTGSSLAMVCAQKGYKTYFITTDAISIEKRQTMMALGAELEVMPSHGLGITPELVARSIDRVRQLAEEPGTFWTNQFGNPANAIGYSSLGQELESTGDIDAFVMGVGTGGVYLWGWVGTEAKRQTFPTFDSGSGACCIPQHFWWANWWTPH